MSVVHQLCPSCSAPLDIPARVTKVKCPFCGTSLMVKGQGSEAALALASTLATSIEKSGTQTQEAIQEGTTVTQTELRRLQLSQDLSMAQMRLANVQSEIRAIEREPATNITRRQLGELRSAEAELRSKIKSLSDALNPPTPGTPQGTPATDTTNSRTLQNFTWLLFSISGRISRGSYWVGIGVAFALLLITSTISSASGVSESSEPSTPISCLLTLFFILFIWVGSAVSIKRYHDLGKSGGWVFIALIPVIGIIWQLLELGLYPGKPGPNKYG